MTEENIVGREILLHALKAEPAVKIGLVIVEIGERANKEKVYLRNDFHNPPTFAEALNLLRKKNAAADHTTIVVQTGNLNNDAVARCLLEYSPDLILLDGSTIIKKKIFETARIGAVNSHPGLLPKYRGVDSVRWAIYHGDPVGTTCHLVNDGIDTGPILLMEEVPYEKGMSLLEIRVSAMIAGVRLMIDAVQRLADGVLSPKSQSNEGANYFSWAPVEVQNAVEAKLSVNT